MPSSAGKRLVRIVVLSNAAAGAEKQALALSARLRDCLLRHPVAIGGGARGDVSCVRVAFHSDSIAHKLPPLLQVVAARLTGNAFFGYDLSDACKAQLQSGGNSDAMVKSLDGKHPAPLNVVIGCGRTTVALCATLKMMARHPSHVFNIQIQHPRVPLSWFDAVVAPRHDFPVEYSSGARYPKQLHLTTGTVHDISQELLAQQTEQWREKLDIYSHQQKQTGKRRACVAWLIGGPCRGFAFTEEEAHAMVEQFVRILKSTTLEQDDNDDKVAVFVTFSRRTPAKVVEIIHRHLRESFSETDQFFVWDGEGENPYYAFLGLASLVVTTPDSISMTTEAIASAKPVCTISAERAKGKFLRFHQALFDAKLTSPFTHDAVSAALALSTTASHSEQQLQPSEALEGEVNGIADAVAEQILRRI